MISEHRPYSSGLDCWCCGGSRRHSGESFSQREAPPRVGLPSLFGCLTLWTLGLLGTVEIDNALYGRRGRGSTGWDAPDENGSGSSSSGISISWDAPPVGIRVSPVVLGATVLGRCPAL